MPPPKLAKPVLDGTRESLENESEETRAVKEIMDRIEESLDNMSYGLKCRLQKLVSSQISLLKYGNDGNNFDTRNVNDNTHQEQLYRSDSHHDISNRMNLGPAKSSSSSDIRGNERYALDISKRMRLGPAESSSRDMGGTKTDISKRMRLGPAESSSRDIAGTGKKALDISKRMRLGPAKSSSSHMGGTETYASDISKRMRLGPTENSSSDMGETERYASDTSKRMRLGLAESSSSDKSGTESNSSYISKRMHLGPVESSSSDKSGTDSNSSYISKRMVLGPAESSSIDKSETESNSSDISKRMQLGPTESSSSDKSGTESNLSYISKRMQLGPAESSSFDKSGTESNSSYISKRMQLGPAESSSSHKSGTESNSSYISKRMQWSPVESSSSEKSGTESNSSYISKRMQLGPAESSSSDKSGTESNSSYISKRMHFGPAESSSFDKIGTESNSSYSSIRMHLGPMKSSSSDKIGTESNSSYISKRMHLSPAESSSSDKSGSESNSSYISKRMQLGPAESSSSDKSGTETNLSYISKRMQLGPAESSSCDKSETESNSSYISKRMQLGLAESSSCDNSGTESNSSDISKRMQLGPAECSSSDKSGTETNLSYISKRMQLCPVESSSSDNSGTESNSSYISKRMQLGPADSSSSDKSGTETNLSYISKRMQLGPAESSSFDKSETETNSSDISNRMLLGLAKSSSSDMGGTETNLSEISNRMQFGPAESSSSDMGGTERNSSDISKRMRFCPAESSSSDLGGTETNTSDSNEHGLFDKYQPITDANVIRNCKFNEIESEQNFEKEKKRNGTKETYIAPSFSGKLDEYTRTLRDQINAANPLDNRSEILASNMDSIREISNQMIPGSAESRRDFDRPTTRGENRTDLSHRTTSKDFYGEQNSILSKQLGDTHANKLVRTKPPKVPPKPPATAKYVSNKERFNNKQGPEREPMQTKVSYKARKSPVGIADKEKVTREVDIEFPERKQVPSTTTNHNLLRHDVQARRTTVINKPKTLKVAFADERENVTARKQISESRRMNSSPKPYRSRTLHYGNKKHHSFSNKQIKCQNTQAQQTKQEETWAATSPVSIDDSEIGTVYAKDIVERIQDPDDRTIYVHKPYQTELLQSDDREKNYIPNKRIQSSLRGQKQREKHHVTWQKTSPVDRDDQPKDTIYLNDIARRTHDEHEQIQHADDITRPATRPKTSPVVINDEMKKGTYPVVINDEMKKGTYPVVINDEMKKGTYPVVINDEMKKGTYPVVINDEMKKGTYPVVINDEMKKGTYPVVINDEMKTGTYPLVISDEMNNGTYPVVINDEMKKGTYPVVINGEMKKGTYQVVIYDEMKKGTYPVVVNDEMKKGTYPVVINDEMKKGTYPVVINDEMKGTRAVNDFAENWQGSEARGMNINKPHQSEYFQLEDRETENYPMTNKFVRSPVSEQVQTVVRKVGDYNKYISPTLESQEQPLYHLDTQEMPSCRNKTTVSSPIYSAPSDTTINNAPGVTYSYTTAHPSEAIRYTHLGHCYGKTNDSHFTTVPTQDEANNKNLTKKVVGSPVSKRLQTVVKQIGNYNKPYPLTLESQEKSFYHLDTQERPYCRNKTTYTSPRHSASSDTLRKNSPCVTYSYTSVHPSEIIQFKQDHTTGRNLNTSPPATLEDLYKVKPPAQSDTRHHIPADEHLETTSELIPNDSSAVSRNVEDIGSRSEVWDKNTVNRISFKVKSYRNPLVTTSPMNERGNLEFSNVETSPIERAVILPMFDLSPEPETRQTLVNSVPLGEQITVYYPNCFADSSKQTFTDSSISKATNDTHFMNPYFSDGLASKYASHIVEKETKQAGFSNNPKKKKLKISCVIQASPDAQRKITKCVMKTTLKLHKYNMRARGNDKEDRQRRLKSPSLTDSEEELEPGDIIKDSTDDRFGAKKSKEKRDHDIQTDRKGNNRRYSVNSRKFASSESLASSDLERQTEIFQTAREARQNGVSCSVGSQILASSKSSTCLGQERQTEIVQDAKETHKNRMSLTASCQVTPFHEQARQTEIFYSAEETKSDYDKLQISTSNVDIDCQTDFLDWKSFESWFHDIGKAGSRYVSCDNISQKYMSPLGHDESEHKGAYIRFHEHASRSENEWEVSRPSWECNSVERKANVNIGIDDTEENTTTREMKEEIKLTSLYNKYGLASATTQEFEEFSASDEGIDETKANATTHEIKEEIKLTNLYNKYGLVSATKQKFEEFSDSDEGIYETKANATMPEIKEEIKLTNLYNKYGLASATTQEFEEFSDSDVGTDETKANTTTHEIKQETKLTNLYNKYGLASATTQEFEEFSDSKTKENAIKEETKLMHEIKEELSKEVTNLFLKNRWAKQEFESHMASTRTPCQEFMSTKTEDTRTQISTNRMGTTVTSRAMTRSSQTFWKYKRNVSFNTVFKAVAVFGIVVGMVLVFGPKLAVLLHRIVIGCILFIWCNITVTHNEPPVV